MKKIVILLLTLALLLPALALSAAPPTFDFTAEEWLARYQEVVGEDSEWYIDKFEETGKVDKIHNYGGMYYAKHTFEDGTYVRLLSDKKGKNPRVLHLSVNTDDMGHDGITLEVVDAKLVELRDIAEKCIVATSPDISTEEISEIFTACNIVEANYKALGTNGEVFYASTGGLDYEYAGSNWLKFVITPIADSEK